VTRNSALSPTRLPLTNLPRHDWQIARAQMNPNADWPSRLAWLLSLGISRAAIRKYRLDRYPDMSPDCWECMVREALRAHNRLHNEQQRRKNTFTGK
jgi:hypothetical protein